MKKSKKTIGEMSNSRMTWGINPVARVKGNKVGKGSYKRQQYKKEGRE